MLNWNALERNQEDEEENEININTNIQNNIQSGGIDWDSLEKNSNNFFDTSKFSNMTTDTTEIKNNITSILNSKSKEEVKEEKVVNVEPEENEVEPEIIEQQEQPEQEVEVEEIPNIETPESGSTTEAVNVLMNNRKPTNLMTKQEKEEEQIAKIETAKNIKEANSDTNFFSQIGKTIENLWLGAVNGVKEFGRYISGLNHSKEQEAVLLARGQNNKNAPSIINDLYKAQENKEGTQLIQNVQNNNKKSPIIELRLAKDNTLNENIDVPLSEQTQNNLENMVNEYKDAYGDIEINSVQRNLSKSIQEDQIKIAENSNKISNPFMKGLSELLPSTGNSLVGAGLSMINPYLGMSYFMISASGSYETEGRNRGMTKEEARAYGSIMGWAEGATEMVGIDKFLSAGKSLRKRAFKEALKDYGLNMADNAVQEAIIDPIDELTAYVTSGKTKYDYSTKEGWEQLGKDMIQDAIDGALSALLMDGIGASINSSVYLYNKIRNGDTVNKQDIVNAYRDIQDNGKITIKEKFKEAFNYQKEKLNHNDNIFTVVQSDIQGNINFKEVKGEIIDINNNKLNIIPAVIYDNDLGNYNIIDTRTGTKLDTTPYQSRETAINAFIDKIDNIDKGTIKSINNQVAKTQIEVHNKYNEIQQKINDTIDEVQKQDFVKFSNSDKLYNHNEFITYIEDENRRNRTYTQDQYNDITKTMDNISDNAIYNNTATKSVFKTVDNNVKNVNYIEQSGSAYVNSLDSEGNVVYQQKLDGKIYTGNKIKSIFNTAVQHADTNVVDNQTQNSTQTSSEPNTSTFYSNETNYAVQDIKKVTKPFSKQESYSRDELAETWNNEISNNNYDAYYDNNGNIERYIAIEEDGNNIVVNQYDNNDNVVKSEVIPSENGRYNASDIQDTINRVASLYDENRPIKGQKDIEGNKVRSIKKETKTNRQGLQLLNSESEVSTKNIKQNPVNVNSNKLNGNKKYRNITELLEAEIKQAEKNFKTNIKIRKIDELENINFKKINQNEYIKLSKKIFKESISKRIFQNGNSNIKIKVILEDIKESAYKAYSNKFQNKYLKEHIQALSQLDKIIESATEKSKNIETKNRKQYKDWKYFTTQAIINNKPFLIEFDVTNKNDGYHFRLQRLAELNLNNNRDTTLALPKKQGGANSR